MTEITAMDAPAKRPEFLDKAEAEKFLAEARAAAEKAAEHAALARKTNAEALMCEYLAETGSIELERQRYVRKLELASNEFHHAYVFDKDVNPASVNSCIKQLVQWERNTPEGEQLHVDLRINSPGGGIFEGFALIDHIRTMQAAGHTVDTTAYGMAASMGGVLLQVGDTRRMGENAILLIHQAQFGAAGSYGDVEDRVKLVDIMQERILALFAERAHVSKSFIKRNWHRKDWWMPASEALKHGFIDEVV